MHKIQKKSTQNLLRKTSTVYTNIHQQFSLSDLLGLKMCQHVRKTKIICSIGKESMNIDILVQMVQNGMDAARINSAFPININQLRDIITKIRQAFAKFNKKAIILIDTMGSVPRIGYLENSDSIKFEKGDILEICDDFNFIGNHEKVGSNLPNIHQLNINDVVELEDGHVIAKIIELNENSFKVVIEVPGTLNSGRRIQFKSSNSIQEEKDINQIPTFLDSDYQLIKILKEEKLCDFLCISFCKSPKDIEEARNLAGSDIKILAKIGCKSGIKNFQQIIEKADGAILIRSALGAEVKIEKVASIQKKIIQIANNNAKPIIISSQMLESMKDNLRPTRAETSDVANAILDGCDGISLASETAIGKFPIESIKIAKEVCEEAESCLNYESKFISQNQIINSKEELEGSCKMTTLLSFKMRSSMIICRSLTGVLPFFLQKYKPLASIVVVTNNVQVQNLLLLRSNVFVLNIEENVEDMEIKKIAQLAVKFSYHNHLCKLGDQSIVIDAIEKQKSFKIVQIQQITQEMIDGNQEAINLSPINENFEENQQFIPQIKEEQEQYDINELFDKFISQGKDKIFQVKQDPKILDPLFKNPNDFLWDEQKLNEIQVCFPVNLTKRQEEIARDVTVNNIFKQQSQIYYDKNNLTQYFSHLMSQLIINQPEDPIQYLIEYLEKLEKGGGHPIENLILFIGVEQYLIKAVARQCKHKFNFDLLVLQDLLQIEIQQKEKFSKQIQNYFEQQQPVSDEINNEIMKNELSKIKNQKFAQSRGIIIAGYPQNLNQAIFLQQNGFLPTKTFIFECNNIEHELMRNIQNNVKNEISEQELLKNAKILEKQYIQDIACIKNVYKGLYFEVNTNKKDPNQLSQQIQFICLDDFRIT